jgi:hypothetical protein
VGVLNKNKKEYKFQQKYCYFGKTFKEQAREVHVRIIDDYEAFKTSLIVHRSQ